MSRTASLFVSLFDSRPAVSHRDTTPNHARTRPATNADPLRYLPPPGLAGWSALPERDRRLLEWLLVSEYLTADLAAVLGYGSVRIAQRRLARLRAYRLVIGFWTANAQRPRGRFAYRLSDVCRRELERLVWAAEVRPPRQPMGSDRSIIHHLAVHDLLGIFLRAARSDAGLIAWLPERVAGGLFDGYLRPDAIAALRLGDRLCLLFVERDTGSERLAVLAAKARRYRAVLGSRAELHPAYMAFVTDSPRRARSVLSACTGGSSGPPVWAITTSALQTDPLGAAWLSAEGEAVLAELPTHPAPTGLSILRSGCLLDPDQAGMLDERALEVLPMLDHFRRRSGL